MDDKKNTKMHIAFNNNDIDGIIENSERFVIIATDKSGSVGVLNNQFIGEEPDLHSYAHDIMLIKEGLVVLQRDVLDTFGTNV